MDGAAKSTGFIQRTDSVLPPKIIASVTTTLQRYGSDIIPEILEDRKPGEEHIRLPYDVIHVIAQCLAEESLVDGNDGTPRTTLARLNRVSKAVHWDFAMSIKPENPKGWAWTKYLCMGVVSEGLLYQHQKYLRGLHDLPDENPDLAPSFPRLRLACYLRAPRNLAATRLRPRITLADLTVEIFKPVRFEELQSRCRPFAGGSFDMFCVLGVNPRFPTSASRNSDLNRGSYRGGNLLDLVVAEGAGILPPSTSRTQGRSWNVASCGTVEGPATNLSLFLKDPVPTPLTASTIDFALWARLDDVRNLLRKSER